MGNEGIDVAAFQAVASEDFFAKLGLLADGELEHRLAVLMNVVHPLLDRFLGGGMKASAARHVERATARAIHLVDEIDQAFGIIFRGLQDDGAGSIAEDHAGGAVGVVDDRRHHVGSDHHDFLVHAGGNELRSRSASA